MNSNEHQKLSDEHQKLSDEHEKLSDPAVGMKPQVPWSTGLCGCFSDCNSCCMTIWCPCITYGRVAEIVDKGAMPCCRSGGLYSLLLCLGGFACFLSCCNRTKMRQEYLLHESPCGDCLVHCLCECCALCQEYRELQNRGFDMSLGWQGNVERQDRGVVKAPITEEGMSR